MSEEILTTYSELLKDQFFVKDTQARIMYYASVGLIKESSKISLIAADRWVKPEEVETALVDLYLFCQILMNHFQIPFDSLELSWGEIDVREYKWDDNPGSNLEYQDFMNYAMGLHGRIAAIVADTRIIAANEYSKNPNAIQRIILNLAKALWYMVEIAEIHSMSLEEILQKHFPAMQGLGILRSK